MDYSERVRERLTNVFAETAKQQTAKHFYTPANELTYRSVLLLLLLVQKMHYVTAKRLDQVKGMYVMHAASPYEKLRTEAGRQTIDNLIAEHTADLQGLCFSATPKGKVLFAAIHSDLPSPIIRVGNILDGLEEFEFAQFIRNGGTGASLSDKCHIY